MYRIISSICVCVSVNSGHRLHTLILTFLKSVCQSHEEVWRRSGKGSRPVHFYCWKAIANAGICNSWLAPWLALLRSAVYYILLFYAIFSHLEDYI